MSKKSKGESEEKVNIHHTMAQTADAQHVSQQLSEMQDLKQHEDAPKIAGYMLLKPIGSGAYAQVWEAVQIRTRKFVAVKVFVKKTGVHWFFLQREADRMIRLDKHPNIVSLLDADLGGEIPYYVMELAQEGSLERYIQEKKMAGHGVEIEQAVSWIEEVAQALHYVHAKQMVHCDLKPANVLLDEEGHVRVADFGHSRVLTESGGALGTLFYMAPEQAMTPDPSQPIQPDVRWDIYALGCTAYSLLSGHVPHEEIGTTLEKTPDLADRLRIYRNSIETNSVPELFIATKGKVDRDLSAIIAKCMKTRPEDRYQNVGEILKDIKARRDGKPVSPLAKDLGYWISKFVTRHRWAVLMAGVAVVVALGAMFLIQERQKAQVQDLAFNAILRGKEFLDKGDEASAVAYFAEANRIYPSLLARGNAVMHLPPLPEVFFPHQDPVHTVAFSSNGRLVLTAGGANGAKLWDLKGQFLGKNLKTSGKNTAAAFSPNGSRVVTGDSEGEVRVFDALTQKPLGKLMKQGEEITSVSFSPDGKFVLSASASGTAKVWKADTGQALNFAIKQPQGLYGASFSPNGKYVLTVCKDGNAHVWNAENGGSESDPIPLEVKNAPSWYKPDVFFTPDSRFVVASGVDGSIRFYEKGGHHTSHNIYLDGVDAQVALSPSGHQLVTSAMHDNSYGVIRIFSLKGHIPTKFTFKSNAKNSSFAMSPDGNQVVAGGMDHSALVWSTSTGKPIGHTLWQGDIVTCMAFSPSGKYLVTGSKDGLARLWGSEKTVEDLVELEWKKSGRKGEEHGQTHSIFSPNGQQLLTYGPKGAYLWDANTGKALGTLLTVPGGLTTAFFSPDGKNVFLGGKNGAEWVELASSKVTALKDSGAVSAADVSPDGKSVAAVGADKMLRSWNANGDLQGKPLDTHVKAQKVLFSPDGQKILVMGTNGALRIYAGSETVLKLDKYSRDAVFTADSQKLVMAAGSEATLYDAASGKVGMVIKVGKTIARVMALPDRKTVLTLGADGTGRLWNAQTGEAIGNALKHDGSVEEAVLSADGSALLTAYRDGGWQIWDTQTGEPIGDEVHRGALTRALTFNGDSRGFKLFDSKGKLVKVSTDWVDPKMDPSHLIKEAEAAGYCKVGSQGSIDTISTDQWIGLWTQFRKNDP